MFLLGYLLAPLVNHDKLFILPRSPKDKVISLLDNDIGGCSHRGFLSPISGLSAPLLVYTQQTLC